MTPIAYTVSPYLVRYLEKIEIARRNILLLPIPPIQEISLLFQTAINRVHYGLSLCGQTLRSETIKTILSNQIVFATQKHQERYGKMQKTVIGYKQGLDYIKKDWLLSNQTVNLKTLYTLAEFITEVKIQLPDKRLQEILDYLQSSSDNPFVLACLSKFAFRSSLPMTEENEIFSTLCAYLFLYKSGMDCRGFLLLEKPWSDDKRIYDGQFQTAINKPNITSWLEYNVKLITLQLESTYQELVNNPTHMEQDKIGNLNERQKTIMTLLEDPKAIITNRTVQKIFHISQITASRDLSRLSMLGLLFPHGKGRSVRYTRI
jgi:uncharacterized membrane protein